jgi:hypothetical protein
MSTSPSQPATKRSKTDTTSWRDKCITKFNLRPVPDAWTDSVARGSESAWERYYHRRCKEERTHEEKYGDQYNSDGDLIDEEEEDSHGPESNKSLMQSWKWAMEDILEENKYLVEGCQWMWTPFIGSVDWDDSRLISANYYSTVWSPYVIPHAVELHHYYHSKPGWSKIDFYTEWEYYLRDFEEEESKSVKYQQLCSNRLERIDVIKTPGLNKETYNKLRSFLYGTHSPESEAITCSALNFWRLIFASMGTTDPKLGDTLRYLGCVGYHWEIDDKLRKKLHDEKAVEPEDEDDPNGRMISKCSWLRHKILEITDNLGPVTKYYEGPKMEDGCDSDEYEGSDSDDGW